MGDEVKEEIQTDVEMMNKSFSEGLEEPVDDPVDDPIEPVEPVEPIDPVDSVDPDDPVEPVEPIEPIEPVEPVEPIEPTETEKEKELREENESLRAKLAEVPKPKAEPEPDPVVETELTEQDFIGDLDLDEVTRDPTEFNKLLNKVYLQAANDTRKTLGEGVLRTIPDIVKANIVTISNLKKAKDDFYDENKDLKPFKKVVGAVFEELQSDNPDKTYTEILGDVAIEVRTRLELKKEAVKATPAKNNTPPKLHGNKGKAGSSSTKPKTDALLNELDEMSQTLGR